MLLEALIGITCGLVLLTIVDLYCTYMVVNKTHELISKEEMFRIDRLMREA